MSSVHRYTEDVLLRDTNYRLRGRETWIDVKNLCVKVSRCDTGVEVSIYPEVDEGFGEPLVTLFRAFPELDEDAENPRKNIQHKRRTGKKFSITKFMNNNYGDD